MDELHLSTFQNDNGTRVADVLKDKYHYIVRMQARHYGMMREYRTVLLENKSELYAENTAENFVLGIGPFEHLDWEGR